MLREWSKQEYLLVPFLLVCRVQGGLWFLFQWKFLHTLSSGSLPVPGKMWKQLSEGDDSQQNTARMHRWNTVQHHCMLSREALWNYFFSIVRCLYPSISECSIGCVCVWLGNMFVRRRAYLHLLHGQCYFLCPRGFKHDVQLMQCLPQDERWEIWCQIQAKPMHHFSIQVWFVFLYLIPVSYLSRQLSLHSALWGWGMDTLGSMCSETEHAAPQEGGGVT